MRLIRLSHSLAAVMVMLFLSTGAGASQAVQTANCTFDTFSAHTGYSFSQVEGISDDGTVVGQLVDNKTQQWMAFTRSPGGAFTEYAAPNTSSTWLYGRSGIGVNVVFYKDKVNPAQDHCFIRQEKMLTTH